MSFHPPWISCEVTRNWAQRLDTLQFAMSISFHINFIVPWAFILQFEIIWTVKLGIANKTVKQPVIFAHVHYWYSCDICNCVCCLQYGASVLIVSISTVLWSGWILSKFNTCVQCVDRNGSSRSKNSDLICFLPGMNIMYLSHLKKLQCLLCILLLSLMRLWLLTYKMYL